MDEENKTKDLADDGDNVDEEVKVLSSRVVEHFLETWKIILCLVKTEYVRWWTLFSVLKI